jgi:transcriptional regulator with XRE-family HTH domain
MDGRHQLSSYIAGNTSQAQFAREVACSQSHLSLFLKGKRGVSVPLAKRISEKSGVDLRALVSPEVADLIPEAAE